MREEEVQGLLNLSFLVINILSWAKMGNYLKSLFLALALLHIASGSSFAQDFWKGVGAYNKGDYETALIEFRASAELGDGRAQFGLGVMYDRGFGVLQNYNEAAKWFHKSAEQGDAKAQFSLGSMYRKGQGVTQDYKEAVKWFRRSAKQGNSRAQRDLGIMYKSGVGVLADYKEAVKWYRKSAEQGNERAQYNLGFMYLKRMGVIQDNVSAHMWFNIAASLGNKNGIKGRDSLAKAMTAADISKAQKLAKECVRKQYKGC